MPRRKNDSELLRRFLFFISSTLIPFIHVARNRGGRGFGSRAWRRRARARAAAAASRGAGRRRHFCSMIEDFGGASRRGASLLEDELGHLRARVA